MLFGFIGFRVIKTAIAAIMAILLADSLGLHNHLGAGTLAILAVEVTRRKSLSSATSRFLASIVSLILALFLFKVFGFALWVLAVYILLTFPIIAKLNFKQGIVTSAVVVFHLYGSGEATWSMVWNEVLLLACGLGSATLVNMIYMPNEGDRLEQIRIGIDQNFSSIFSQVSRSLRDTSYVWDGHEITDVVKLIDEGIDLASKELENRILPTEDVKVHENWLLYFYMRKRQMEMIQHILQMISMVYQSLPSAHLLAEVFEQLSEDVLCQTYTGKSERLLLRIEPLFKQMELPKTREEFEIRAMIYQVLLEVKQFLHVAKKDKKQAILTEA